MRIINIIVCSISHLHWRCTWNLISLVLLIDYIIKFLLPYFSLNINKQIAPDSWQPCVASSAAHHPEGSDHRPWLILIYLYPCLRLALNNIICTPTSDRIRGTCHSQISSDVERVWLKYVPCDWVFPPASQKASSQSDPTVSLGISIIIIVPHLHSK